MSFSMFWVILWPLILGFTLSAIVQSVVSHNAMAKTLGCEGPKCLTFATLYGIASSSCSYAAVALARSIFQKGASFVSAMAFELASTNLVIELGIILFVILGWQFTIAEYFGGVVSFIFADLIILPILDIYRKYYGWKVMGYILLTFYVTMAAAGYVVEFVFGALGIIPTNRNATTITEGISWNYTTILNIIFLILAAILVIRFIRTGGIPMLRMMNKPAHEMAHHEMG